MSFIGITSRLLPEENTSMGNSVAVYDTVADPEDTENEFEVVGVGRAADLRHAIDWRIRITGGLMRGRAVADWVIAVALGGLIRMRG